MEVQRLPLDIISTLPQSIIESILCLVPIPDAVRTSVLSRKWRYNWVNIPKLVFDEDLLFKVSTKTNQLSKRRNLFDIIYPVLLLHHGPILEFAISVSENYSEVDLIILHLLSRNTIKKFTLYSEDYKLPSSFFSLEQLTHLNLYKCELWPPYTFIGFGKLTSLHLDKVYTTSKLIIRLISNCPLLKSFTLIEYGGYIYEVDSTIIELFDCFPPIEHLCMNYDVVECFPKGGVPQHLPTSLVPLKHLDLLEMEMSKYKLPFAFLLMRSSPKLEKIKIEVVNHEKFPQPNDFELEDYLDVCLDYLTELEIENFGYLVPELEFVKLILVKSPMLKKVRIVLDRKISSEEELKMLRILLRLQRASPSVEIIVSRP